MTPKQEWLTCPSGGDSNVGFWQRAFHGIRHGHAQTGTRGIECKSVRRLQGRIEDLHRCYLPHHAQGGQLGACLNACSAVCVPCEPYPQPTASGCISSIAPLPETLVATGDCVHQAPGIVHYLFDYSEDMEYLEIVGPANFTTIDAKGPCEVPAFTPWKSRQPA